MSSVSTPIVRLDKVGRSYLQGDSQLKVLSHVSLSIHRGDHIALVGRSGSGKSTLLHLIAGLDRPSEGVIEWPGVDVAALRPGHVGIMFQSQSLIPWLSVRENVALPLQLLRANGDALRLADDRLERFGLGSLAAKLPQELSGGQAQRASLVRAIITNPDLLLADEPTGQLDHATAEIFIDTLFNWGQSHGAALVIATHDRRVAARFAHQIRIEHGRLETRAESRTS